MKKAILLFGIIFCATGFISGQSLVSSCHQPDFNQKKHFIACYYLSQEQVQLYIKLREDLYAQYDRINQTATATESRREMIDNAFAVFKTKVSAILTKEQYKNWKSQIKNFHHLYLKEELLLSKEQLQQLQDAKDKKLSDKTAIRNKVIAYPEKELLYVKLNQDYEKQIRSILGEYIAADYLSKSRMDSQACDMMDKFDNTLTFNNALKLLRLEQLYDSAVATIKAQITDKAKLKEAIGQTITKFQTDVKSSISPSAYRKWEVVFNPSLERKLTLNYKLDKTPIAGFKNLVNAMAIDRYKIKHEKLSKEEKRRRLDLLEREFVAKVRNFMSAGQYEQWLTNRQYIHNHRKEK